MKKLITTTALVSAIIVTFISSGNASNNPPSQVVTLHSGWNVVSVTRVVASHAFSAAETSNNFDIYVLEAGGWKTLADLNQQEFTPLYGYFIQNKTGQDQTLTFSYRTTLSPDERLFSRTFSDLGWHSIGPANPTYMKLRGGNTADTNNVSNILSSLSDGYASVLDFTAGHYATDPDSAHVADQWALRTQADADQLNDLRELKGYAVYITSSGTQFLGFQNDGAFPPLDITVTKNSAFGNSGVLPSLPGAKIGSFVVQGGTDEGARISSVSLDFAGIDDATTVGNMILKVNDTQQGTTIGSPTITGNTYSVSINVPKSTPVVIDVYADVRGNASGTAQLRIPTNGVAAVGLSTSNQAQAPSSPAALQLITFAAGSLKITKDFSSPVEQILTPANGVLLGNWKFEAKNEDLRLGKVTFTVRSGNGGSGTTASANFGTLYLKDGSTTLASGSIVSNDVVFSGFNLTIPTSGSKILSLYSDLTSSVTQLPNSIAVWTLKSDTAPTDIDVTGSSGQLSVGSIDGETDTTTADTTFATSTRFLYHNSKPVLAAASNTPTGSKSPAIAQEIFIFTVTNTGTREMRISAITVTISASGGSVVLGRISDFDLYDGTPKIGDNGRQTLGSGAGVVGTMGAASSSIAFGFDAGNDVSGYFDNFVLSFGASKTLTLKADTTNIRGGLSSGQNVTFNARITGSIGYDAANNIWNTGNFEYYYTPVFGTEVGPYTHSDSYPVNGGTLSY